MNNIIIIIMIIIIIIIIMIIIIITNIRMHNVDKIGKLLILIKIILMIEIWGRFGSRGAVKSAAECFQKRLF
jgi:hypothetical protein